MHCALPFNSKLPVSGIFLSQDAAVFDSCRDKDVLFCKLAKNAKLRFWFSNAKLPYAFWRWIEFSQRGTRSRTVRADTKLFTFHPTIEHSLDIHFAFMECDICICSGNFSKDMSAYVKGALRTESLGWKEGVDGSIFLSRNQLVFN